VRLAASRHRVRIVFRLVYSEALSGPRKRPALRDTAFLASVLALISRHGLVERTVISEKNTSIENQVGNSSVGYS